MKGVRKLRGRRWGIDGQMKKTEGIETDWDLGRLGLKTMRKPAKKKEERQRQDR